MSDIVQLQKESEVQHVDVSAFVVPLRFRTFPTCSFPRKVRWLVLALLIDRVHQQTNIHTFG